MHQMACKVWVCDPRIVKRTLGNYHAQLFLIASCVKDTKRHEQEATMSLLSRIRGKYLFGNRTEAVVKLTTTGSEARYERRTHSFEGQSPT